MGLFSDYIDWVRGSYAEYDQVIQEQDLGVGSDYEALTGEPFDAHVVGAIVIGAASGTVWVGPATHLAYHGLDKLYAGVVDFVSRDDVVRRGENTFSKGIDWLGKPVIPGLTRGDVLVEGISSGSRAWIARQIGLRGRCTSKNWRGKRCTLYRGHSKFVARLGEHDYA